MPVLNFPYISLYFFFITVSYGGYLVNIRQDEVKSVKEESEYSKNQIIEIFRTIIVIILNVNNNDNNNSNCFSKIS